MLWNVVFILKIKVSLTLSAHVFYFEYSLNVKCNVNVCYDIYWYVSCVVSIFLYISGILFDCFFFVLNDIIHLLWF